MRPYKNARPFSNFIRQTASANKLYFVHSPKNKNYLTFNTDLSENGSSLNDTILSGTLPALNANEYYLINYEIVETHPSGSDMTVGLQNNI